MIYGKYTPEQWSKLTDEQQLAAIRRYVLHKWRLACKRQYTLEVGMRVAGSQLQGIRG